MAITHDSEILVNMKGLSNLTSSAESRVTSQLYSLGSSEIQLNIGEELFTEYMDTWDDFVNDEATYNIYKVKGFSALDEGERKFRNMVFAESYFILYFLAKALKKLVKGSGLVNKEKAGTAEINPSGLDDLINNAELYYSQALNCISLAFPSTESDTILFSGSLGAFAV